LEKARPYCEQSLHSKRRGNALAAISPKGPHAEHPKKEGREEGRGGMPERRSPLQTRRGRVPRRKKLVPHQAPAAAPQEGIEGIE